MAMSKLLFALLTLTLFADSFAGFDCPDNWIDCGNGKCVGDIWRCDGDNDCGNFMDEQNCEKAHNCSDAGFSCSNGHCDRLSFKCDGGNDCGDNSDEIGCSCEGYTCPVSGECISWYKVCDDESDCNDLMDEGPLCANSCSGDSSCHMCRRTPLGPRCSCYDGYVHSKDRLACEVANECNPPGRCSLFCNNTKDGLKCSCAEGYVLDTDQRTCKAVGKDAYLAYLVIGGIRGLSLATTYYHRLVYIDKNFESVIGIDYDAADGIFFWADRKRKTINRFPMDSAHLMVSFKTQHEPVYLRRDWMTKNLYYTTAEGSIVCCNGNGSYCTSVITNVSSQISGIAISPKSAFIFWSASSLHDHISGSGTIERANMDGSVRMVIVSEHIVLPTAITVDPVLETIYWCDSVQGVIESTDFKGFRRRKIVEHLQYPISLAVFEDFIYWSDRATNSLRRCNKFSCEDHEELMKESSQIKFLVIVHEATQMKGKNHCADNNCLHLCFPNRESFVCKCDDRFSSDTANCERSATRGNQSCPGDYCSQNAECVVEGDSYVCRCPSHFTGERCEESLGQDSNSSKELNPVWLVCAALIVICAGLFASSMIFYMRYRRKSTEIYSSVQYVNTGSCQESCVKSEMVGRQENEYQTVIIK